MSTLSPRQISGSDGGLKEALIAAELPTDDILEGGRRFFSFTNAGSVIGYGGFEPHGAYALIRSLVVALKHEATATAARSPRCCSSGRVVRVAAKRSS